MALSARAMGCTAQTCRSMPTFWASMLAPLMMTLHMWRRYRRPCTPVPQLVKQAQYESLYRLASTCSGLSVLREMQCLNEEDAPLQMMEAIADDDGWTVSYNNELRVLYKHARSE